VLTLPNCRCDEWSTGVICRGQILSAGGCLATPAPTPYLLAVLFTQVLCNVAQQHRGVGADGRLLVDLQESTHVHKDTQQTSAMKLCFGALRLFQPALSHGLHVFTLSQPPA
jgi:hypothetical protein